MMTGCLQLLFDLCDETPIKIHIDKVLIQIEIFIFPQKLLQVAYPLLECS